MGRFETYRESIISSSYDLVKARVLQTAFELGLFDRIGAEAKTVRTLSEEMKANENSLELFLNALVSLGLLENDGPAYRNTKYGFEIFIKGKPFYVGDTILLHSKSAAGWMKLGESVISGKPVETPDFFKLDQPEAVGLFIRAMHNTAVGHAETLAKKISLDRMRTLLDLGGGSGAFTIEFLRQNPGLKATIFDLSSTLVYTKQFIEQAGLLDRVQFQTGNFIEDEIVGVFDVCFISHVIHGLGAREIKSLFEEVIQHLSSGGKVIIQDFFLNSDRKSPQFASLFALNMLLHTDSGRTYTFEEVTEWLEGVGFGEVTRSIIKLPRAISLLIAHKK